MTTIESILEQHSLRTTAPRKAVFEVLKKHDQPLLVGGIAKLCPQIDRVSVYRTVELFETLGIVQVFHMGFKKGYELAEPFKEHHHHIHCKSCHAITPIHSHELERTIHQLAANYDYELSSHHIELWGVCDTCRKPQNSPTQ